MGKNAAGKLAFKRRDTRARLRGIEFLHGIAEKPCIALFVAKGGFNGARAVEDRQRPGRRHMAGKTSHCRESLMLGQRRAHQAKQREARCRDAGGCRSLQESNHPGHEGYQILPAQSQWPERIQQPFRRLQDHVRSRERINLGNGENSGIADRGGQAPGIFFKDCDVVTLFDEIDGGSAPDDASASNANTRHDAGNVLRQKGKWLVWF